MLIGASFFGVYKFLPPFLMEISWQSSTMPSLPWDVRSDYFPSIYLGTLFMIHTTAVQQRSTGLAEKKHNLWHLQSEDAYSFCLGIAS